VYMRTDARNCTAKHAGEESLEHRWPGHARETTAAARDALQLVATGVLEHEASQDGPIRQGAILTSPRLRQKSQVHIECSRTFRKTVRATTHCILILRLTAGSPKPLATCTCEASGVACARGPN